MGRLFELFAVACINRIPVYPVIFICFGSLFLLFLVVFTYALISFLPIVILDDLLTNYCLYIYI